MTDASSLSTSEMNPSNNSPVLSSLLFLDQWRKNPENYQNWTRIDGNNLDVFSLHANTIQGGFLRNSQNEKEIAICHLIGLLPFTKGNMVASEPTFQDMAAIALAAHHLNVGDGSIVPQVKDLNNRCAVRFTTEFFDTEYSQGTSLQHVVGTTTREPSASLLTGRKPCAFVGPARSSDSIPTSIITGLEGYVQISGYSTSAVLDDKVQFPLFARTVPSDTGNAIPIIIYFHKVLHISHLAVINVNDAYGNAFVDGLRNAAKVHAPDMIIQQVPLDEGDTSVQDAITSVKTTQFQFIFCIIFTQETHDALMTEAYDQGIAGDGIHNWLFGDSFVGILTNRQFEIDSKLAKSYNGVGELEASGGVPGIDEYDNFATKMGKLVTNNPQDLKYLQSLFPRHDNSTYNNSFPLEDYLEPLSSGIAAFWYEATIALGLAACDATRTKGELSMTGREQFDALVDAQFTGITGEVIFDKVTGTRDPSTTLYKVTNFVQDTTSTENGQEVVQFKPVVTDLFADGQWVNYHDYIFNDGTTRLPSDLPEIVLDTNYLHSGVRAIVLSMCVLTMGTAIGFALWTTTHRKTRVVLASQPFFLYIICSGVFIMGSTIIPLSIDPGIASPKGCSVACTAIPWLLTTGFLVTFSALFTKTWRVNRILNQKNSFKRIKVTMKQVLLPMVVLLIANTTVLSLMTALNPFSWQVSVVTEDNFGRPTESLGQCQFTEDIGYIIALAVINAGALFVALCQSFKARNLSTEFAESQYTFKAVATIVLVVFVGAPVLAMARENSDAFVFVLSAIIFVSSTSILLLMFVPKIRFAKEQGRKSGQSRVHISGMEESQQTFASTTDPEDPEDCTGMKILTTKTPEQLVRELNALKQQMKKLEESRKGLATGSDEKDSSSFGNSEQPSSVRCCKEDIQDDDMTDHVSEEHVVSDGNTTNVDTKRERPLSDDHLDDFQMQKREDSAAASLYGSVGHSNQSDVPRDSNPPVAQSQQELEKTGTSEDLHEHEHEQQIGSSSDSTGSRPYVATQDESSTNMQSSTHHRTDILLEMQMDEAP